ncbi:SAV_2336 N-terminal domain-related protein [Kitasatospora purpeofusca]|uniref:SAV_2336 N-terminal domain-related protein n=1 Tax=Kitasatospora purpeofusca TaxID=67352 RepID=UPI0035D6A6CB
MPDPFGPPELLRQLGRLLTADGAEPAGSTDPRDLADVLWLARVCGLRPDSSSGPAGELALPGLPTIDPMADERAAAAWTARLRAAVDRAAEQEGSGGGPARAGRRAPARAPRAEPVIPLHLPPAPVGPAVPEAVPAATVRSPARPALTGTLALSRALRPLRRTVRSVHELILDEEATVSASGRAGLLLPVWRGAPERWFEVDVVLDRGPTMAVWSTLGDELVALLRRHGAFHRVRAWSLDERAGVPVVTPRGAHSRRRGFGLGDDPRGRRVILLLTDGVGPLWHSGALPVAMRGWSRNAPVTVLQVLPRRHWHRTALRPVATRSRLRPGERPVVFHVPEDGEGGAAGTAWAGVLELRADWLAPWARMLSGRAAQWTPAMAVPLSGPAPVGGASWPQPVGEAVEEEASAALLARFRRDASPMAWELAGFLAAAPLSLPVMRHVQAAMLADSSAMHLAEIYLSGLLERRFPARPGEDPEAVLYDFRAGVRERLLATLTRSESAQVLRVLAGVSRSVAGAFGGTLDFRTLAALAEGGSAGGPGLPEPSVPFAEVAVEVLRGLGGADGDLARRLAVRLPAGSRVRPSEGARPASGGGAERSVPVAPGGSGEGGRGRRWWLGRRWSGDTATAGTAGRVGESSAPTRPAWNNLPPGLPDLAGREEWLLRVERVLHPGAGAGAGSGSVLGTGRSLCVVQGAAGAGKTVLALAYAHLHLADYSLVWWVDGRDHDSIARSLDHLAALQGLASEGRAEALNRWLERNPGWLIVIDDLAREMPEGERWMAGASPRTLVGDRWPPEGYGSVLVTSRVMTHDRAVLDGHLLQLFLPDGDAARPAGVSEEETQDDLAALPELLSRTAGRASSGPRPGPEPAAVAGTPPVDYGPSLDVLAQESAAALEVLNIGAFLAPVALSVDLIDQGLRAAGRRTGLSPVLLNRVLARNLMRITPDRRGSVSLHMPPGLHRAVTARLTHQEQRAWAAAAVQGVVETFPSDPSDHGHWAVCEALVPHAHTVLLHPDPDGRRLVPRVELLYRLARLRAAQGEFDAAEAYLRQRRALARGLPRESVDSAVLMARVLLGAGRFEQALEVLSEAMSSSRRWTVEVRRLAAALYREMYRLDDARNELGAVAEALASARPPGSPDLLVGVGAGRDLGLAEAEVNRERGLVELEAGSLPEAERYLERAWTGLLRLGSVRQDVAVVEVAIRQDRARLSLLQGHPSFSACEVLAAAIRRAGTARGAEGLDVIMSASETLVDVVREYLDTLEERWDSEWFTLQELRERQLRQVGDIARAVVGYRRERVGEQPHRLATALDMYGMLHAARGDYDRAEAALEEAAALHRRVYGPDCLHPAWGENRWRLARVRAARGDAEGAAALAREAHAQLRRWLSPAHPRLRRVARLSGDGPV